MEFGRLLTGHSLLLHKETKPNLVNLQIFMWSSGDGVFLLMMQFEQCVN